MKIQKLPNGEIQITFRPDEIANFQTALPLDEIANVKRFEDCLHNIQFKTRDFLKELRDHFGVGIDISRKDKKLNELRFKYQVANVAQTIMQHEKSGLISINKIKNSDPFSKILTFKFNF